MDRSEQKIILEENRAEQIIGNAEMEKEGTEEMSSNSMNTNTHVIRIGVKEQKAKKNLKFGGWLPEVLDWIKRTELAQSSLSTSSHTFRQYCWPYLHGWKVKPRIVPELGFLRELNNDNGQNIMIKYKETSIPIPIANVNPPEYIIGFEFFKFEYIDERALEFMQKILPLLKNVTLGFHAIDGSKPQNDSVRRMVELLAPKISKLAICESRLNNLNKFNKQFPGFINGVQLIIVYVLTETVVDLVVKWLTTPKEDDKPKILRIISDSENPHAQTMEVDLLINCVKEEFVSSTEIANFYCFVGELQVAYEDFKIGNEITKEVLEFKREENYYYLIRHKNDDETKQIVDILEEQFEQVPYTFIFIDANV